MMNDIIHVEIPRVFSRLKEEARYKLYYGGRGGGKSWAFAQMLILISLTRPIRVLCAREFQQSIKESVYQLLVDTINKFRKNHLFKITDTEINGINGSNFFFKGLARNLSSMKSLEGVDIVWVEEAQSISQKSIEFLIPTIRKEKSELWFSWNPDEPTDAIELLKNSLLNYSMEKFIIQKVTWRDNPWFPKSLDNERLRCRKDSISKYQHIWEGDFVSYGYFFEMEKMLVDKKPLKIPEYVTSVFATMDTTMKGGIDKDGTAVCFWGLNLYDEPKNLYLLDWDLVEYEGSMIVDWIPRLLEQGEEWAVKTKAINGFINMYIEDKAAGTIVLQDGYRKRHKVRAIDSKLTALGKDRRCLLISDVVENGQVKITEAAFNKVKTFRNASANHLIRQITSFQLSDKEADKRQDDLLDAFAYGVALGLKDSIIDV